MVQMYAALPIQCSMFFYFFCIRLDAVCFMAREEFKKDYFIVCIFCCCISMLFQETLEAISQQLSWYTFNADMYSF